MSENRDSVSDKLLGSDLRAKSQLYGNLPSINAPDETGRGTFERHDIISDEINDKSRHSTASSKEVLENQEGKDILGLSANMKFYYILKEQLSIRNDDKSKKIFNFHKNVLVRARFFFLFIFIVVEPFFECPEWCI